MDSFKQEYNELMNNADPEDMGQAINLISYEKEKGRLL